MTFQQTHDLHVFRDLVFVHFPLPLQPVEEPKIVSARGETLSSKYELRLTIQFGQVMLEPQESSSDDQGWKVMIRDGILELKLKNCRLLRETWTNFKELESSTLVTDRETHTVNSTVEGSFGTRTGMRGSRMESNADQRDKTRREVDYRMISDSKDPNGLNIRIIFTSSHYDKYGNRGLDQEGLNKRLLGTLEISATPREICGIFKTDLDGLCVTHNGKERSNLFKLLMRNPLNPSKLDPFPKPIQEQLNTLTGEYLSYVKLCSS